MPINADKSILSESAGAIDPLRQNSGIAIGALSLPPAQCARGTRVSMPTRDPAEFLSLRPTGRGIHKSLTNLALLVLVWPVRGPDFPKVERGPQRAVFLA
jgi:hypothetical protein